MKGTERRREILHLLSTAASPFSGTSLAERFSVSRQVIVQDMALLRAEGHEVISTTRGYLLHPPVHVARIIKAFHTDEEMADELNTIVDQGGVAEDVFVRHRVYGELRASLHIASRRDVERFMSEIKSGKSAPLKDVTSGYHYHTVSADSEATLDLIEAELERKGYLCRKKTERGETDVSAFN